MYGHSGEHQVEISTKNEECETRMTEVLSIAGGFSDFALLRRKLKAGHGGAHWDLSPRVTPRISERVTCVAKALNKHLAVLLVNNLNPHCVSYK